MILASLVVILGAVTALGVVYWRVIDRVSGAGRGTTAGRPATASPATNAAAVRPAVNDVLAGRLDDGGFLTAARFMAPLRDPESLQELRAAVLGRGKRGIAALRAQLDGPKPDAPTTREQALERIALQRSLGLLYMYEGEFAEAAASIERALILSREQDVPPATRAGLTALLGIIALRRGEVENCLECLGPSSCIFPIAPEAVHRNPAGSRAAVRWFTAYLEENPRDLRIVWLLNLAAMTLGEHPEGVPPQHRIPLEPFRSQGDVGRFENVAARAGLTARGPNLAGGSCFDDFTGDGRPDLFSTSLDADRGASLFVNRGDGTFEDVTLSSGTGHLQKGHGVSFADYDDDGDLDLFVELGGASPGDRSYNALFQNPGHGHHWLKVKLVGTTSNRSAFGAKIRVDLTRPDGSSHSIHRTVGNNSSFGGNCLVETIGLLDAARVAALTVSWPTSRTTQTFRDLAADQAIEINEGSDTVRSLPRSAAAADPQ